MFTYAHFLFFSVINRIFIRIESGTGMHRLLHMVRQLGCLLFLLIATDSVFFDYPTPVPDSDISLSSRHIEHHYFYLPNGQHEKPVSGGVPVLSVAAFSTPVPPNRPKTGYSDRQQIFVTLPLRIHLRI